MVTRKAFVRQMLNQRLNSVASGSRRVSTDHSEPNQKPREARKWRAAQSRLSP